MKKEHNNEKKLKESLDEDLEPMSYIGKLYKQSKLNENNMDFDINKLFPINEELDDDDEVLVDDGTTPDDEKYAKQFIRSKLVDAQEIIESLSDYLAYSDYAVNKGGDLFKHYLEKSNSIFEQLRHFMDD